MCVPRYLDSSIIVDNWDEPEEDQFEEDEDTLETIPVLSLEGPTLTDMERTIELRRTLAQSGVFLSRAELAHREQVVGSLQQLLRQWIRGVAIDKNMHPIFANALGGNIYTSGSYRLGVQHKGATLKALCVAPRCIDRCDFFQTFFSLLRQQPQVKDVRISQDEHVLVIKMEYDSIKTDLHFARLALTEIPASLDLSDDSLLRKPDRRSVHSMNGCRVSDEILRLVPDVEHFRVTLKLIRLWAKRRGIYSSSLGYLGGDSWAILVACICQLYPNAVPATLVHKFFLVFSQWQWPQPVMLKRVEVDNMRFRVWDPTVYASDIFDLMPIISPAYPQQNTTVNVNATTRSVIMEELRLGLEATNEIMSGRWSWERLFEGGAFFSLYNHYLVLVAAAELKDPQRWIELVEADIRVLNSMLDRNEHINIAHVYPECYKSVLVNPNTDQAPGSSNQTTQGEDNDQGAGMVCYMWFIGLSLAPGCGAGVELTRECALFTSSALLHARCTGLRHHHAVTAEAHHVHQKHLNQYLPASVLNWKHTSFMSMCVPSAEPAYEPYQRIDLHLESSMDETSGQSNKEDHPERTS